MIEKNSIRNAYDNVAESYASVRSESGQDIAILAEFLEPLSADSKILDAGCGQLKLMKYKYNLASTLLE